MTILNNHLDVLTLLDNANINYDRVGRNEIEADVENTGHYSFKINTSNGLWFTTDGSGRKGNLFTLARLLGVKPAGNYKPITRNELDAKREEERYRTENSVKLAQRLYYGGTALSDLDIHSVEKMSYWRYEAKRGISFTPIEDRIRIRKPDPKYDYAEIEQGCVAVVLFPMYEWLHTYAMFLCGVQRLYLKENGEKIGRKSLGKQGFLMISPVTGKRDILILGEGVETTLAVQNVAGYDTFITYNANNLLAVAERLADEMRQPNPPDLEVWLLVDRDKSGMGQRVCAQAARALKDAGVKTFYLEPPEAVKGGAKGADWNDALLEIKDLKMRHDGMRALIGIAKAQAEDKLQEAMQRFGIESKPTRTVWNMQQTDICIKPADTKTDIQQFRDYTEYLIGKAVYDYTKPKPYLIGPTMGAGKTNTIRKLIKRHDCPPTLVLVASGKEAEEYERNGFARYHGRTPDEQSPGYCPQADVAKSLGEKGHLPQAEYCHRCPSGLKYAMHNSPKPENRHKAAARLAEIGYRVEDGTLAELKTCVWLAQQQSLLRQKHVVATYNSFSPTLASYNVSEGTSIRRRVIIDEQCPLSVQREVTLKEFNVWAKQRDAAEETVRKRLQYYEEAMISAVSISGITNKRKEAAKHYRRARRALDALIAAKDVLQALAAALPQWLGREGKIQIDDAVHEQLQRLIKSARVIAGKRKRLPTTAEWERAVFDNEGKAVAIPLRALTAIALTLEYGDGFIRDGALHVVDTSACYDAIHDYSAIVLDATPSQAVIAMVQGAGGEVHMPLAKQNVKIIRRPTRFWGTTPFNKDRVTKERMEQEFQRYVSLLRHHYTPDTAILMHLAPAYRINNDKELIRSIDPDAEELNIGYWGQHHRAHNGWEGKNMVIVGSFWPPKSEWRKLYLADRVIALASGAPADDWPEWTEDMPCDKAWIHESGNTEVKSLVDLPADKRIRDWLLENATAETVQAIGRARAINAPEPLTVHIYGGLPLQGLHKYGLEVDEYANDPEAFGRSRHERAEFQHKDANRRFDQAATKAVLSGKRITRETLYDILKDENGEIDRKIICTAPVSDYYYSGTNDLPRPASYSRWIAERFAELVGVLATVGRNAKRVKAAIQEIYEDCKDFEAETAFVLVDALHRAAFHAWLNVNGDIETRFMNGLQTAIIEAEVPDDGISFVTAYGEWLAGELDDPDPPPRE